MEILMLITALCGGIFALLCYRRGLREGRALTEGMQILPQASHDEVDPDLERIQTILQNINSYNGSADYQNEVE